MPPEATQTAARTRLIEMGARGVPVAERVFGAGSKLRPNFIQPYRCQNVLVDGVTIVNSPMWLIHPVLCRNVTVRNVVVNGHGPNNDGCDPESCRDVLIERCTFDTGDDCIALKSGRNEDGRRLGVPNEGVVVRDCSMKDGHGGVVIGSEVSGGARNVFAERCRMDSPNLDRALRLKTNSVRGGFVEHVYMRNIAVGQVAEAVVTIDLFYEESNAGKSRRPSAVDVRNVTSGKSQYTLRLRGYAHAPVRDIRVTNYAFDNVAKDDVVEGVTGLTLKNVRVKRGDCATKPSAGDGVRRPNTRRCRRWPATFLALRIWLYPVAAFLVLAGASAVTAQPSGAGVSPGRRPGGPTPRSRGRPWRRGLDHRCPEAKTEIKAASTASATTSSGPRPTASSTRPPGQPITDLSTPVRTAGIDSRNGKFNDWSYSMGVVLAAMLHVSEVTGDASFQECATSRTSTSSHAPALLQAAGESRAPGPPGYGPVIEHAGTRSLRGHRRGASSRRTQSSPTRATRRHQPRHGRRHVDEAAPAADGALARPRPMPVTLLIDDTYMSIPFFAQMGKPTGDAKSFDDAARRVIGMSARLFNSARTASSTTRGLPRWTTTRRVYWGHGGGWMMIRRWRNC